MSLFTCESKNEKGERVREKTREREREREREGAIKGCSNTNFMYFML